ncbi:Uncharacterised protein [uncultured archaeon]|nr:Uncharacterised protein [uncultured archaeon]
MFINIKLSDEDVKLLGKRAKKNLLTLREQVEDIVRRSCINSKKNTTSNSKCDDSLVNIFSRDKRGGKK